MNNYSMASIADQSRGLVDAKTARGRYRNIPLVAI